MSALRIATRKSPLALWDTHYLRELDLSGFIAELAAEEPQEFAGR